MLEWMPVDRGFDVITPVVPPVHPEYIAIDTFCCIMVMLTTLVGTLMDTKLLLYAMRTQVRVHRTFRQTVPRISSGDVTNSTYDETLARALDETFNSFIIEALEDD